MISVLNIVSNIRLPYCTNEMANPDHHGNYDLYSLKFHKNDRHVLRSPDQSMYYTCNM